MTTHRVVTSSIAAILVAVAGSTGAAQRAPSHARFAAKLSACRVTGLDEEVLCGRHDVPEDRSAPAGRKISLNVVVLPATSDSVVGDPLVFLAGGGVVPATRYARFLAKSLPKLRRSRDILLVDQRGTGGSNPLSCDRATLDTAAGLSPDERYLRFIAACRELLAGRADVRMYTTVAAIQDLDEVRAWLAYQTLDLYGASYGTSVAQAYVRGYPSRVRALVMHGVVPLDVPMQLDLARSAQASLERVFALCGADTTCHAAFPDPARDLTVAFARFDAVAVASGPPAPRGAGRQFSDRLNSALATIDGIRTVPLLVHEAASGVSLPEPSREAPEPAPLGVRLAILCSEGLAGVDTAAISRATAGTFLGEFPVRFQMRWCDGWPTAPLPAGFRAPFRAATPALLLVGELDPITPASYAERVAAWFTNGSLLRLPNRSHSDTDPCVMSLIESFVMSGGSNPDGSCLRSTPPIVFTTSRQMAR